MAVVVRVKDTEPVGVSVSTASSVSIGIGPTAYIDRPEYDGEFTVTPTQETQVLETAGKWLPRAVTINPIPSNYGLITWNGSVLTVS